MPLAVPVKDCKVVLKDTSFCHDAEKLKMLNTSQKNTHRTSSHLTKEERLFGDLSVKTPMSLHKANDECWPQLDSAVLSKLKN